jgi:hypothetical protein
MISYTFINLRLGFPVPAENSGGHQRHVLSQAWQVNGGSMSRIRSTRGDVEEVLTRMHLLGHLGVGRRQTIARRLELARGRQVNTDCQYSHENFPSGRVMELRCDDGKSGFRGHRKQCVAILPSLASVRLTSSAYNDFRTVSPFLSTNVSSFDVPLACQTVTSVFPSVNIRSILKLNVAFLQKAGMIQDEHRFRRHRWPLQAALADKETFLGQAPVTFAPEREVRINSR